MCRYIERVKCLNESLLRWIDQHVRSTPCCILTPVFRDYEKHVDDLNKTYNITPDRLSGSSQTVRADGLPTASFSTVARHSAGKYAVSVACICLSKISPIHTADANETKLFRRVASAVCT